MLIKDAVEMRVVSSRGKKRILIVVSGGKPKSVLHLR